MACLIFIICPATNIFRKDEKSNYKKATGEDGLTELKKAGSADEIVLYCILMFIFVTALNTLAWILGVKYIVTLSIINGIAWFAVYSSIGWTEVDPQDFQIVETFGNFKRVIFSGPHILCFPGLIDKPRKLEQSMKKDCLKFFQAESNTSIGNMIDFKGGYSAEIEMTAWYVIKNPILWTYRVEDEPTKWLEDQLFRAAQAIMEAMTLKEATTNKLRIATETLDSKITIKVKKKGEEEEKEVEVVLQKYVEDQLGIKVTSLIINDINIPEEIRDIRMEKQRGTADRERRIQEARGYEAAIQEIRNTALKDYGRDMPYEEAKKLYDENQDRKVMNGSNVTIIGSDISNALHNLFGRK